MDHSTDTYDTIDWLVKNVPESNGKVGILGISYDGFLTLMALVNPHPALKVAVPMNPMVDGWMGDDWFHNGAFRELNMPYIYEQEATRSNSENWWTDHFDDYDVYMEAGSAGELGRRHGLEQVGFWKKLLEHPSYDSWWQQQAMDKILAAQPLKVPMMLVDSLWDQEDIYGAPARLQGDQAQRHQQRHGVSGDGTMASRAGDWGRQQVGRDQVQQRHGAVFSGEDSGAVSCSISERWRAQGGGRARERVRDRNQYMATAAVMASGLRERMHDTSQAVVSAGGIKGWLRCSASGSIGVRRVRI